MREKRDSSDNTWEKSIQWGALVAPLTRIILEIGGRTRYTARSGSCCWVCNSVPNSPIIPPSFTKESSTKAAVQSSSSQFLCKICNLTNKLYFNIKYFKAKKNYLISILIFAQKFSRTQLMVWILIQIKMQPLKKRGTCNLTRQRNTSQVERHISQVCTFCLNSMFHNLEGCESSMAAFQALHVSSEWNKLSSFRYLKIKRRACHMCLPAVNNHDFLNIIIKIHGLWLIL